MADPENPIGRVREIEVAFTAVYQGIDAWNADEIVKKLEAELIKGGFDIKTFNLQQAFDENHKVITEDQMREYIYRKHGHAKGRCNKCPDPIKWREVERLKLKEFYKNKEVLDDMTRGRVKGFNYAVGELIRPHKGYETKEELMRRYGLDKKSIKERKLLEKTKKLNNWETKEQKKVDHDIEPKLQYRSDSKNT